MTHLRIDDAPLIDLLPRLRALRGTLQPGAILTLDAPDPDLGADRFDGERGPHGRHRSWAEWQRIATALRCALATPRLAGDGRVLVRLRVLGADDWQAAAPSGDREKYGAASPFARIDKFEQADHLVAFQRALGFVKLPASPRVLAVGAHLGGELVAIERLHGPCAELVGLDHAPSAIAAAQAAHPDPPYRFALADLRDPLTVGRFDLIVAINVLHSPALDGRAVLKRLIRTHLAADGRIILGLPNCRYQGVARRPGGKVRGQLFRDVSAYRRYLNQHRFATLILGTSTVLIAGRRLPPGG